MANYKLLALDLDGTLTNTSKQVSLRNRQCIGEAISAGVQIILASGRPTLGVAPLAELLGLYRRGGFIVTNNGGSIIDCGTGRTLFQKSVPTDCYHVICETSRRIPGVGVLTYDDVGIVSENTEMEYIRWEARNNGTGYRQTDNLELDCGRAPKPKFLVAGEPEPLARAFRYLTERLQGRLDIYYSETYYIEVVPLGAEKALALERIVRSLGYSREDLMACGDGLNDIPMLDYAGLAVVMENGYDETKRHADCIVPSNDDDGVAVAIERYLLNAPVA